MKALLFILFFVPMMAQCALPGYSVDNMEVLHTDTFGGRYINGATYRSNYVFACGNSTFLTLFAEDLSQIRVVAATPLTNPPAKNLQQIILVKDIAYVIEPGFGVRMVDIADPAEPKEIKSYSEPLYEAALFGTTLYLGSGRIMDVTEPRNPRFSSIPYAARPPAMFVKGDLVYWGDQFLHTLWIHDLRRGIQVARLDFEGDYERCLGVAPVGELVCAFTTLAAYILKLEGTTLKVMHRKELYGGGRV